MDNANTCLICLQTVYENECVDLECRCNPVKPSMHHKCYKVWEQTQKDNGKEVSCPHCRQVSKIIDYKMLSVNVETGTISLSIEHPYRFKNKMFTPGTRSKLLKSGHTFYDLGMYKLEITKTTLQMYLVNTLVLKPLSIKLDLIYKLQLVSKPGNLDELIIYSKSFNDKTVISTIKGSSKTKSIFNYLYENLDLEPPTDA